MLWYFSCCLVELILNQAYPEHSFLCSAREEVQGAWPEQLAQTDESDIPYCRMSCSRCKLMLVFGGEDLGDGGGGVCGVFWGVGLIVFFVLIWFLVFVCLYQLSNCSHLTQEIFLFYSSLLQHEEVKIVWSACVILSCWLGLNHNIRSDRGRGEFGGRQCSSPVFISEQLCLFITDSIRQHYGVKCRMMHRLIMICLITSTAILEALASSNLLYRFPRSSERCFVWKILYLFCVTLRFLKFFYSNFEYIKVLLSLPILVKRPKFDWELLGNNTPYSCKYLFSSHTCRTSNICWGHWNSLFFSELSLWGAASQMCLFRYDENLLAMQP